MRKLFFSILFMFGGMAYELRNPTQCLSITATSGASLRKKLSPRVQD